MRAARELLTEFQHDIIDLRLIPGDRGIFDVEVDGKLVFSKFQAGRHAEPGEVVECVQAGLGLERQPLPGPCCDG